VIQYICDHNSGKTRLIFGRPFVKQFALCYRTVVCPVLSCLSVTFVHCGQTVGRIKMKLGMQVPRPWPHCVRWGPSSPSFKEHSPLQFSAHICCGQMTAWIKMSLGMEVCLVPGDCVRWGPCSPLPKRGAEPPPLPNFRPMFIAANGWMDEAGTWHGGGPQPR